MSRHRTTLRMHRVKDKKAGGKLAESRAAATDGAGAAIAKGPDDKNGAEAEALTPEALGRYLAAEVSLRESGEERGATTLARYFKLTLVMAGFNMLVASASLVMVFSHSAKPQTIVVTAPTVSPAPAAAPKPPQMEKAAVASAPMSLAPTLPSALVPAPLPPAKTPLLGRAPSAPTRIPLLGRPRSAPKRSVATSAPRAPRVSIPKPLPTEPPVLAKNATDESAAALDVSQQTTERW
jgi:hypothetical protein